MKTVKNGGRILEKMEKEAIELLDAFKEHPIKSLIMGFIILWGVKALYRLFREDYND